MTIEELVQKHGKKIIQELIGMSIIKGSVYNKDVVNLMIEHKVLRSNAKHALLAIRRYNSPTRLEDGTWLSEDNQNIIQVLNGRSQSIIYIKFKDSELQHILEVLNNANENIKK